MGMALVPFGDQHIASTYPWLESAELRARIDSTAAPTADGHERYWRRRIGDKERPTFAITLDGAHIGNCGLVVDDRRRKAELWIYLGLERGRGVGRAATEELLAEAFDRRSLHRVFVRVLATNESALRFWRSRGFADEGRLRADTWVDGSPVDALVLGMLQAEWRGMTRT